MKGSLAVMITVAEASPPAGRGGTNGKRQGGVYVDPGAIYAVSDALFTWNDVGSVAAEGEDP
jgi:hypothetical protein